MAFSKEMVEIANQLRQHNHEVILPRHTEEYANRTLTGETSYESTKNKIDHDLIRDYYEEMKLCDVVLIANIDKNGISNYIGGNSFLEMGFAHVLNKKVFLLNDIPDMIYTDEIKAIQPVILNGDLLKINQ